MRGQQNWTEFCKSRNVKSNRTLAYQKKRPGRPEKPGDEIGTHAAEVWNFLQERIEAGWKLEAAVQAALEHFKISRAQVFKHIATAELAGVWLALNAMRYGVDVEQAFAEAGLEGLLKRLID